MLMRWEKMKISKTGFINLIRCNRFAALEEINRHKEESLVTFTDNMEDLMTLENIAKRNVLLDSIYDLDDSEDRKDLHFEVMQPYYNQVELLTAKAVKKHFKGEFIYSSDTFKQASFSMEKDGYQFYCFLDGLLKGEKGYSVFETKATTSRKYLKMEANKESIFVVDENNILRLKKDLNLETDNKYEAQERKFFDKYSDVGSYVYDLAFQRFVMENSKDFIQGKDHKYYLALLNYDYIFDGRYDENNEPIYSEDIIMFIDFTSITERYLPIIERDMRQVIKNLDTMNANPVPLGKFCQYNKNRECKFTDVCFAILPEKVSLLNYLDNHHGFKENNIRHSTYDLINAGYHHMLDIPVEWLTRENNLIQRQVVETKKPYFNYGKITAGINELKYPIYHLDFESFPCPLPRYRGERPYAQSLFQFSVHIEKAPGVCDKEKDNYYFLASDHQDHRENLIKQLLAVIKPDGGSVCVYNIAFEKTRIRELGELFPQYENRLTDIANRLFDLLHIVKTNGPLYRRLGYSEREAKKINFYDERLGGSYSIKVVLPLFTNLSYGDLNISDGEQAFSAYAKYPTLSEEEFLITYQSLLEYCKQDTWAMVEILKSLRELT